jgi:hypothetical protein
MSHHETSGSQTADTGSPSRPMAACENPQQDHAYAALTSALPCYRDSCGREQAQQARQPTIRGEPLPGRIGRLPPDTALSGRRNRQRQSAPLRKESNCQSAMFHKTDRTVAANSHDTTNRYRVTVIERHNLTRTIVTDSVNTRSTTVVRSAWVGGAGCGRVNCCNGNPGRRGCDTFALYAVWLP